MPITPQDYAEDAIKGKHLERLVKNEVFDRLKGDVPETLAHALCVMAAEIDALKAALAASNLGERVADSLDAQTLKVGGVDVMPQGSITGCYLATYGSTTLADIREANDDGKLVFTRYENSIYVLKSANVNRAVFIRTTSSSAGTIQVTLYVNSSNVWSHESLNVLEEYMVEKYYGNNSEAEATITASDISNGYIDFDMEFTDMVYGNSQSIVYISLPNYRTLAATFSKIEVYTNPHQSEGNNPMLMCKFNDLTHDDDGNALPSGDYYTWIRTCNDFERIQRIVGMKARCYLQPESWPVGGVLKLKISFNAILFYPISSVE